MSYTYFCCIVFLQLPSLDLVPRKTFMRMEKSEDEENITETTVMLEMEEAEDRGSSQEFPPRENMTRTEFLARGGFQETCGAEYYM